MSDNRPHGFTAMLAAAALALTACGSAEGADSTTAKVAHVDTPSDGGPGVITLSQAAVGRLAIATAPVTNGAGGLVVPYSAVVYEADGSSWVFVQTEPLTYQRAAIAISSIAGDAVNVTSGPPTGTEVVTVGAAELVGVEIGIDGEE
jgi:hypothetical protein